MSNPTSNFGWQMPTPVDLVTDLPADFEVFGQAVDSSLADLKGGTSGQVLSKNSNTDMDFVWTSPNPGDITGVTAGTGISGGGTSGDVTITNSMATAIDAKGDLIAGTSADAFSRLAVGANGETLVADSAASTGLRWQGSIAGGKNFCINGGMDIWQRGTSFTATGVGYNAYTSDRWTCYTGGTGTFTQDTSLSASGFRYGNKFTSTAASNTTSLFQMIETDQTIPLAGKQVALSGFCLSPSGKTPVMNLEYSTTVNDSLFGSWLPLTKTTITEPTATGSLLQYKYSFAIPTTAKTLRITATYGSLNNTEAATWTGIQLELGNVPTPFSRAGGTIQGELAACQRYYYQMYLANSQDGAAPVSRTSSTNANWSVYLPVTMRTSPTIANTAVGGVLGRLVAYDTSFGVTVVNVTDIGVTSNYNNQAISLQATNATMTAAASAVSVHFDNANVASSLAFSSEL